MGKRCGKKKIQQEEINFLMVALADSGHACDPPEERRSVDLRTSRGRNRIACGAQGFPTRLCQA